MAQTLCQLKKKGGGKMAETILWTNSAPTSAQSTQDVTLSQGIDNFKYIKFIVRNSKSNANSIEVIYPIANVQSSAQTVNHMLITFGGVPDTTSYNHIRRVYYKSNTVLNIGNTNTVGGSGSFNDFIIITQIIGLK